MSDIRIKRVDVSQIRYTPEEGEIVQDLATDKFYIYKDNNWMLINVEGTGIHLGLYDMNKQIIEQLPVLTDLEDKKYTIDTLHAKFNNEFYMMYGKEISYFTLFKIVDSTYFANEVIDCLGYVGAIKAIDLAEDGNAIEIWVQTEDGPTCLYLFPYDSGLVQVG